MDIRLLVVLVLPLSLAGCFATEPEHDCTRVEYDPDISPDDFVAGIDHPYLAYTPGTTLSYQVREDGEVTETIEIEVLERTENVNGVEATVVHDQVFVDGELLEDTYDWFAQDKDGNVWYVGEETVEYDADGEGDTAGSFRWGTDGALPGLLLPAATTPTDPYYMEYYWADDIEDSALDQGQVIGPGGTVTTPAGTFTDTLLTNEWTCLDPGVREEAYWAAGVGAVQKGAIEGDEQEVLVAYELA